VEPRFISIPDFCARYSVNRQKAYDLINAGAIVAVKNVGKTVIDFASAEAWADQLPTFAAGTPAKLKAAMAARGLA
jgi:hypothetical protein